MARLQTSNISMKTQEQIMNNMLKNLRWANLQQNLDPAVVPE